MRRALVLMLGFGLVSSASAEDVAKVLKKAVKATLAAESRRVVFDAVGGFASGPEHSIVERHVSAAVEARTFGRLTAFDAPFVGFRLEGGDTGAVQDGDKWVLLNGRPTDRLAERMFIPLASILDEVAAWAKYAEWIEEGSRLSIVGPSKSAVARFNEYQSTGCFEQSPQGTQQATSGGC